MFLDHRNLVKSLTALNVSGQIQRPPPTNCIEEVHWSVRGYSRQLILGVYPTNEGLCYVYSTAFSRISLTKHMPRMIFDIEFCSIAAEANIAYFFKCISVKMLYSMCNWWLIFTIQMWWEFQHAVVSGIFHYYPFFAHVSTAVLLRDVQNLVEIE